MTAHNEIVECARTWLKVPWLHQGRTREMGVDCIGLLIGIAREKGLVAPDFDVTGYHRSPDGTSLMESCERYMTRLPRADLQPGRVVVVSFDTDPQHFGVVGNYCHGGLSIIHALAKVGEVVETRLMFSNAMRFVACYDLPGVG